MRTPLTFSTPKKDLKRLKSNLGNVIYNLRKAGKVSQETLGRILTLHQTAVCRVEQGSQNLTPEELYITSKFFDVNVDALLTGEIDYWRVAERFGRKPP